MNEQERARIIAKLLDAPPGILNARELFMLAEVYYLHRKIDGAIQFLVPQIDDEWLRHMDQIILPGK